MKKAKLKVVVPVSFTGAVEVDLPPGVPQERREALARKVALARILATTENPDAPEDDACAEYEKEFGLGEATAGRDWDGCKTAGVSGSWSLQADDDHDGDDARSNETGMAQHRRTVRVPVEIAFTTDPAELDDRQGEPAPTRESLLEYLQNALVLNVDTEGTGQPEGAAFAAAGIDWDTATFTEG